MLVLHPLSTIGEVRPGDDLADHLAGALAAAELGPVAGDVLVVTQKIVSKAEGRLRDLAAFVPGAEAQRLAQVTGLDPRLVEIALSESVAVVRAAPNVLITRHRCGFVMANAGVDRSNVGPNGADKVLLLPEDPDASAARLRMALAARLPAAPAVIVSDSFGRPWRVGAVNVAIGAAGLPALLDRRGQADRDGRILEATQVGLADMIASAAGLVTGEGDEGIPAVLVRGMPLSGDERPAAALVRPLEQDLFQ